MMNKDQSGDKKDEKKPEAKKEEKKPEFKVEPPKAIKQFADFKPEFKVEPPKVIKDESKPVKAKAKWADLKSGVDGNKKPKTYQYEVNEAKVESEIQELIDTYKKQLVAK